VGHVFSITVLCFCVNELISRNSKRQFILLRFLSANTLKKTYCFVEKLLPDFLRALPTRYALYLQLAK
ncbi:MAG: hypothetical protein LBQ80_04730, partial [Clostridium sp.]|nr:hypothetical protein [Clostridium sp.]